MRINASAAWTFRHSLVFVAHPAGRLFDTDFDEFMNDVRAQSRLSGAVILASDTPLTPLQRAQLQKWFEEQPRARASVITTSVLARGAVTALNWFGVPMCAFKPNDLDGAFEFVQLSVEHREQAKKLLGELQNSLQEFRHQSA
jgi:hypothetical protein